MDSAREPIKLKRLTEAGWGEESQLGNGELAERRPAPSWASGQCPL